MERSIDRPWGVEDPARAPLLARFVEVLREDVRDEEDVLLPRCAG